MEQYLFTTIKSALRDYRANQTLFTITIFDGFIYLYVKDIYVGFFYEGGDGGCRIVWEINGNAQNKVEKILVKIVDEYLYKKEKIKKETEKMLENKKKENSEKVLKYLNLGK